MSAESLRLLRYWLIDLAIDAAAIGLAASIIAAMVWPCVRKQRR